MKQLLKTHFGYDEFRPLQEEIINNVLDKKDTFVLMPTGGGKSLCYQLPALKFDGLTLVISPLIALMKDQVDALKTNGISAEYINSSLLPAEIQQIQEKVIAGKVKILYVAPERLALENFKKFLKTANVKLIAVDEAHCISQWGHDFRPDYRNLKFFKSQFPKIPVIALTATATPKVREDIIKQLSLDNPKPFISSFNRENLTMIVTRKKGAFDKLLGLLQKHKNEPSIIYCFSRKETEEIAASLQAEGFNALPYHAGLNSETRKKNQELFIKDEVSIIVATIAFGMGIDKPDIRLVVHYTFPKTIEGYYQEIGRAGRDGLPSECILFYSYGDIRKHEFFIDQMEDVVEREKCREKLNQVIEYCETMVCRRKYVLGYFGEKYSFSSSAGEENKKGCEACDICLSPNSLFDATEISQKILSCVIRTGNRFGRNYIADVLLGKNSQQIIENRHSDLPVFGIVHDFNKDEVNQIMKSLIAFGFLRTSMGKYPTVSVTQKGLQFLKRKESLELPKTREDLAERGEIVSRRKIQYDLNLFEKLKALRKQIADKNNVPPFMIFSDVSLQEMAYYFPADRNNFAKIEGVGIRKLESFSKAFLAVINNHIKENNLQSVEIPNRVQNRSIGGRVGSAFPERYIRTKEMLSQKLPISEIADKQGFRYGTIVRHIEKLISNGEDIDIAYLKPPQERLEKIKTAFEKCGDEKLKPVFEFLKEEYSYDEIRIGKLFYK
jgi:ATP-dependent DNA helicase RecQ